MEERREASRVGAADAGERGGVGGEGSGDDGEGDGRMTMWTYLDLHPWWALTFLLILAGAAVSVAEGIGRRK